MVNIHIQKLTTKQINTARGLSNVWGIYDGKQWYSSFIDVWNSAWKVGDTLVLDEDQVKANVKGDKTYWNINAPRRTPNMGGAKAAPATPAANPMILDAILLKTNKILNYLEHLPLGDTGLTLGDIMADPKAAPQKNLSPKRVDEVPLPPDTTDYTEPSPMDF